MSHGTSNHPQLLKYSPDVERLKVQEALYCSVFCGKSAAQLGLLYFRLFMIRAVILQLRFSNFRIVLKTVRCL